MKRPKKFSYFFVLIIAIELVFLSWFLRENAQHNIENTLKNQYGNLQMEVAQKIGEILQIEIENIRTELEIIAQHPEIKKNNPEVCNRILRDLYLNVNTKLSHIGRLDTDGRFFCGINDFITGIDGSKYEHIQKILADPQHKPVISRRVAFPPKDETLCLVSIHIPVYNEQGEFNGTLGGAIYLDDLYQNYLEKISMADEGYIMLADDIGHILYHPDTSYTGCHKNVNRLTLSDIFFDSKQFLDLLQEVHDGKSGVKEYSFHGQTNVAAYMPVHVFSGTYWMVITTIPVEDIEKHVGNLINELEYQILAIVALLALLTLAILVLERKRAKYEVVASELKKFKLAVENASEHIIITDAHGKILYANKAVEKITGFSREEIIGHKAGTPQLWGGLMDPGFYKKLWRTIKNEKKVFKGVIKNKRKNGEEYQAAANISAVVDRNGNIIFFVGVERDITHEKEVEKTKTEFVSLASHQLRTPLTAIKWYAEMLIGGDAGILNQEQKTYVEEIFTGNQQMLELVDALLNVSRIELGKFEINPKLYAVESLAQKSVHDLKPLCEYHNVKIEEKYASSLPKIKVDKNLMEIVFQNLLSNAIKYSPKGGTVTLSIKQHKKYMEIIVSDLGLGIPEEEQSKVFTKLFRAKNVKLKETQGTGLGMYMVKSILDHVGSTILFHSTEGKGTTFYVRIPLKGMPKRKGSMKLS